MTPCLLVVTAVSKEVTVSSFHSTISHCLGTQTLQMEVQSYCKSPVATDQSPWRHILADIYLHMPTSYVSMRFTITRQQTTLMYYLLLYAVRHMPAVLKRHYCQNITPTLPSNLARLGFPAELTQLRNLIISIIKIRSDAASSLQPLFLFLQHITICYSKCTVSI